MATLRYELWEQQGIFKRINIKDDFNKTLKKAVDEYPKLDLEYEISVVRKEYDEYMNVFNHLSYVKPTKKTAFLFNKRLK